MRAPTGRLSTELVVAVTATALAWSAASSWRGMVAEPSTYLGPALVAAVIIAVVGAIGRTLRLRWYAVLSVQCLAMLAWLHHRQSSAGQVLGWIPTPHGLAEVFTEIRDGADAINTYAAPVPASYPDTAAYLIACTILLVILLDLIACGLRLPTWAGLPILVAVTIPISVLDDGLPTVTYVTTGLLFALLLALLEADRASTWAPVVESGRNRRADDSRVPIVALGLPGLRLGAVAIIVAAVVAAGVPVGNGFLRPGGGDGGRGAKTGQVVLSNPLVNLRRDLVSYDHLPLVDVRTDSRDLEYLRLTILDSFTDGTWAPSPRDLSATSPAEGTLPNPPGLLDPRTGSESRWILMTSKRFTTTWLPTPPITRSITISEGDWRYDPQFLDIASADDPPPTNITYQLTATDLRVEAARLDRAPRAPAEVLAPMTALPALPAVVRTLADQITAGASSDHEKAALLQSWFRNTGGFTYSLDRAPGDGPEQLARFLTTDKVGYCEQFAAAMALMARSLGIPARVVVGFLSPSETIQDGYRYTSDDLHAWPEIYFSGAGWVRFEPTPGTRTGTPPSWTRTTIERPAPNVNPDLPPLRPTQAPTRRPESAPDPSGPATNSAEDSRRPAILTGAGVAAGILLLLIVVAPWQIRAGQRRRRYRPDASGAVDPELLWRELHATAVDLGAPWPEDRTPRMVAAAVLDWVTRVPGTVIDEEDRASLDLLVKLVEESRYGPERRNAAVPSAIAVAATRRWADLIGAQVQPWPRWRARLTPRSLLRPGSLAARASTEGDNELTLIGRG